MQIVAYGDGSTTNLRMSQMLEAETSGFSDDAVLAYSWSVAGMTSYYIYASPDTSDESSAMRNTVGAVQNYKYISCVGNKPYQKDNTITCTVRDINTQSATHTKEASTTYTGVLDADLGKDINCLGYAMMEGESMTVCSLLGKNGITHITCGNSSTKSVSQKSGSSIEIQPGADANSSKIVALEGGTSVITATVEKSSGCIFHSGQLGSGDLTLFVFENPQTQSTKRGTITLRNTQEGVTYSIGSQSYTCAKDDEEITFTGLEDSTTYDIVLEKTVNRRLMRKQIQAETCTVQKVQFIYRSPNGETKTLKSVEVLVGTLVSEPEDAPQESGHYLAGWSAQMDGTDYWDFANNQVYGESTGKWVNVKVQGTAATDSQTYSESLTYYTARVGIKMDDGAYTGRKVELYQNGKSCQVLPEDPEGSGTYSLLMLQSGSDNYDVYLDGKKTSAKVSLTGTDAASAQLQYYQAAVTVTVDDTPSPGHQVMLMEDGSLVSSLAEGSTGVYGYIMEQKDGKTYSVYVDGTDTKVSLQPDSAEHVKKTVKFHTTSVTLQKDGAPWNDASAGIQDADGVMTVMKRTADGVYQAQVLSETQGVAKEYKLYVYGSASSQDTKVNLSSQNKTETLDYYTVEFKDSELNQTYSSRIVRGNETVGKPSAPYRNGYTFAYWSAAADGTQQYDFTQPITQKTVLYAKWATPTVTIGKVVRCGEDKKAASNGKWYRMSNLTIKGLPEDKAVVSSITLDYEQVEKVTYPTSSAYSIKTPKETKGKNTDGTATTRVYIEFNSKVTVQQAEEFLRGILVKPLASNSTGVKHTMQVTVNADTQ